MRKIKLIIIKMKKIFNALVLSGLLFLNSCEKEGAQGPQGIQGEQGQQGAQGQQGIKGENGITILNGTTDPSNSLGKDGDFYININTKILFGPKKAGNWGAGIELNGKDGVNGTNGLNGINGTNGTNGANGINGNTILSGYTVPSSNLGRIGDFYIDLLKMDFYGPKSSSGWGTPISLKGQSSLQKRILIKENFDYSRYCDACTSYSTTWRQGYSNFSATSADVFINVGDIKEYYNNGIVTYEARINKGEWFVLDPSYKKEIVKQFQVSDREYMMMFTPSMITYYQNSGKLFIGSVRDISIPGVYSKSHLMSILDSELKVDIRITLLPRESVEYLSRNYPNQKVDNFFVSKYLKINN